MNLVIVESPAKSKTIKKYLGPDFEVLASYGHVRDLIPKNGAVDPDDGFRMQYELTKKSVRHVNKIIALFKKADNLYLATDPDREGEAISWHLHEILKEKGLINNKGVYRVVFHEITKRAVQEAFKTPRELSNDLIHAQQARRALDYLVGFNLSPLLWRKLQGGLSAGRVQSPALRMIVERELEIEAFNPREYWTIATLLDKEGDEFDARLYSIDGKKLEQFDIVDEKTAMAARDGIAKTATSGIFISKVEKKQRKRNPLPPFTTSTMQQDVIRKLGFSASKTMRVAQQLYEGVDLGEGSVGLITYMRTDSVTLAADAVKEIRDYIMTTYGKERLPEQARVYKTKSKNSQEAHEAIRPTSVIRTPDQIKSALNDEQYRLYELIWKRTVACQMIHATFDTVTADIACGDYVLRSTGSTIREPGFMLVYTEKTDEKDEHSLPPLVEGDQVALKKADAKQHFTEPPPRYSEASLIKTLEEYGIGRPSTYASIIATLQSREYTILEKKRFHPTNIGLAVNRFLTDHFKQYVDYDFTARLEDELDEISRGERGWVPVMEEFWRPFKNLIEEKNENVTRAEAIQARELGIDPKSGKPVSVRLGRYGPYAQIGTREDEEKPKFASLRPGQKITTLSFEEALSLFELPRDLGETPEGEPMQASFGRFGPYVKYGSKYASLKEDDPHTVTRERALEVVAEKKKADAEKVILVFEDEGIQVLKGRYGPYITDGKKNARIPKEQDPAQLTLDQCRGLIEAAPDKPRRGGAAKKKAAPKRRVASKKKPYSKKKPDAEKVILAFESEGIQVLKGSYGPYITDGKKNARIPKEQDPAQLTLDQCRGLIEAAPDKNRRGGAAKKRAAPKRRVASKKKSFSKKPSFKATRKSPKPTVSSEEKM